MTNDPRGLPQAAKHITACQQMAATQLVALAAAGSLSIAALRELGTTVLAYDIDSAKWHLKGWKGPRRVQPGDGLAAMGIALKAAFKPERVRLGANWVKDASGRVDGACVPAFLPAAHLSQWLRSRCLRELNEMCCWGERDRSGRTNQRQTCALQDDPVVLHTISDHELRGAIHPHAQPLLRGPAHDALEPSAEEFLAALSVSLLTEREQEALRLGLEGWCEADIGNRLGCVERTVRRDNTRIKEKAMSFEWHPSRRGTLYRAALEAEGLRRLLRPMSADELLDHRAGYPASRYRKRAELQRTPGSATGREELEVHPRAEAA